MNMVKMTIVYVDSLRSLKRVLFRKCSDGTTIGLNDQESVTLTADDSRQDLAT